jgi:hypothetical protein
MAEKRLISFPRDAGLGVERTSGESDGKPLQVAAGRKLVEAKPEPIGEDSGGKEEGSTFWNPVARQSSEGRRDYLMLKAIVPLRVGCQGPLSQS